MTLKATLSVPLLPSITSATFHHPGFVNSTFVIACRYRRRRSAPRVERRRQPRTPASARRRKRGLCGSCVARCAPSTAQVHRPSPAKQRRPRRSSGRYGCGAGRSSSQGRRARRARRNARSCRWATHAPRLCMRRQRAQSPGRALPSSTECGSGAILVRWGARRRAGPECW